MIWQCVKPEALCPAPQLDCGLRMGFHSQLPGSDGRIDPDIPPPCHFVTAAANLAMVTATERDDELVADLAAERSALHKAKMVRIRELAAANKRMWVEMTTHADPLIRSFSNLRIFCRATPTTHGTRCQDAFL